MKSIAFIAFAITLSIAGCFTRLSAQDVFPDANHGYIRTAKPAAERWSVIGQWHYAGPVWRGMIDIRPDGTFLRGGYGEAGKWKLAAVEDHFVLVLKWNRSAEDTVELVSPTLFQAETTNVIVRRLN